jgi:hypothetical protein
VYVPQLGQKFFEDHLAELCMTWLQDRVYSIREAASTNLRRLSEVFGAEWAHKFVLPQVTELYTNPNYLCRMTSIHAVKVLVGVALVSSLCFLFALFVSAYRGFEWPLVVLLGLAWLGLSMM